MSSYYGSLVTLSLISDDYICWESSAYVLLPSHSVNFPSPVILIRHRMTRASCPAHVRMLKFTSKINRTLWGVSVVRTLAEHFAHTSLQNRLEHIVSFPSLLPSLLPSFSPSFFTLNLPLSFFLSSYHSSSPLHNTSVTWNAESNDPEVTGYQCLHSLLNWLITLILETTAIQTSV